MDVACVCPACPSHMSVFASASASGHKGVFLAFTIPSKIKLWTWELNVQVRADAYLLSRQAAPQDILVYLVKTLFTLDAQSVADLFLM